MMKNTSWSEAVALLARDSTPHAIATIMATAGSSPRSSGSKMVISAEHTYASIGGGQLEFMVVNRARELLDKHADVQEIKQFSLSADSQQCCGGAVTVLLEVFAAQSKPVVIFGAGHVAQALVSILKDLAFRLIWIDSRQGFALHDGAGLRVLPEYHEKPERRLVDMPDGAHVLVMTHDHKLDYLLVSTLLSDWRWDYLGLIGSENKARRFRARLGKEGFTSEQLDLLDCPMGLSEVKGKLPMEVAVSIAAKLLVLQNADPGRPSAMNWKEMKQFLASNRSQSRETQNSDD